MMRTSLTLARRKKNWLVSDDLSDVIQLYTIVREKKGKIKDTGGYAFSRKIKSTLFDGKT